MEYLPLVQAVLSAAAVAITLVVFLAVRAIGPAGLAAGMAAFERSLEKSERTVREEIARNRDESGAVARHTREEMSGSLKSFGDLFLARMAEIAALQERRIDTVCLRFAELARSMQEGSDRLRDTVEARLKSLQDDNACKLDAMRATVDEKLHETLELRLGESFRLVSERLEQVHKGLGEMQSLALGVGDLKKVLTNVKTRGTWGEVSLGNLLEQVLTGGQYARNVVTKEGSKDPVEFAVCLPGRDDRPVYLPIDAKFPMEDYRRLVEAQEQGSVKLVDEASRQLAAQVKSAARDIQAKYVDPPGTTDFAVMFVPVEGLYAEIVRRCDLCDLLQREFRILVAGPTTLAALLNSLQMGFRTLAIEKRSSEVWTLLGAVKADFGRFCALLEQTRDKLEEAGNRIGDAAKKSRTIERRLRKVQELPAPEAALLLSEGDEEG